MKVIDTKLQDVKIIEMDVFGDHRGFFTESYSKAKFAEHGLDFDFVQDNHSLSTEAGVLRGLHFQKGEAAQTKLIRVVTGAVLDVIVDIRKGSPTYGQWEGYILSEHNHRQLLVPKGFAHGFVTLTPNVNFIAFNDPALAIDWPIAPEKAITSEKDQKHPTLKEFEAENPFIYGEI